MEIKVEDYLSESELKEIAIDVFRENIHKAFGGDEYTESGKEKDRQIKNAVAKWIENYVESVLTETDKKIIKDKVQDAIINTNYSFYIFSKPNVWDRTEYTAYKVITNAVKENEKYIKDKVKEEILKKFELEIE